jgi:hypothetical protein
MAERIDIPYLPAVAGVNGGEAIYYLTAVYGPDGEQKVLERRPGVCLPGDTVRLSEEPLIEWRRNDQLKEGFELILAQAWIHNCQLSRPLSLAARRYARPSQQPYIAAGQTEIKNTGWSAWTINGEMVGVSTEVDTSAARFRTTPRYVAHVAGDRFLPVAPGPLVALGFAGVVDATPQEFTFQVLLPAMNDGNINPSPLREKGPDIVNQLGWHVVWMGIEG